MFKRIDCPPIRGGQLTIGYAAELAARLRSSSVHEFCSDFGINFRNLARGCEEELQAFGDLTNNDVDLLRRFSTIHQPDDTVRLGNALLTKHVMSRSTIRVCPDCVADDISSNLSVSPDIAVIWRRDWVINSVDTCPIHSRPLSEIARISASNLQWDATLAWSDLSLELDALLASPVRREPHGLQAYSIARLEGHVEQVELLDGLPLYSAIAICAKFGALSMNIEKHWRTLDENTRHNAYREGFEVLSRGSEGIEALIGRRMTALQLAGTPPASIGPSTLLQQVATFLNDTDESEFSLLRHFVANAVFDVLPIGPEDGPVLGVRCTHRRSYSTWFAARQFGLPERTIVLYAEAAGVAERNEHGSLRIDAPKADAFFGESGGFVNLATAGKEIGARRPSLNALVKAGLLTPLSTQSLREREHLPIRRNDLNNLIALFRDRATPLVQLRDGAVALPDLHHHIRGAYEEVHKLVLVGEIWLGRVDGGKPYASLYVDLPEVRKRLNGRTAETSHLVSAGSDLLDQSDAAAIAGINHETLRILAAAQLVPSLRVINPKTGTPKRMFVGEEMKTFASENISLTSAARKNRVQPRDMKTRLGMTLPPAPNPV